MSIFQTKEYLDLFARHFVQEGSSVAEDIFEILPNKKAILLGMKHVLNNQEITDFGDVPESTQSALSLTMQNLKNIHHVSLIQFDYVKENSLLFQSLSKLPSCISQLQEVSPYIMLPITWETYLESLGRVERKELKRKRKRLDDVPHEFRIPDRASSEDFDLFMELHKLSDHNKKQFMTDPMKAFFKELLSLQIPGWQQKLAFLYIEDKPVASVFYFESKKEILLYNSGYDPEQKYYSVGLLLIAHLIKKSIQDHKQKFDFLRGNERYKYDLGGKDERLFKFTFSLN